MAARASGDVSAPGWPPFLVSREAFPPDIVAAVERIWSDPTLSRTVQGRPARVPFEIYIAFVDTPEVTAAAARHLKLARWEAEPFDGDWYRATDNDGARGIYRVLVREPHRRVILSWGEHSSNFLGTISGSALTVLDLTPRSGIVDQSLTAHVRIDNAFAAALAKLLVPLFGYVADRKLTEGFTVTARVAEWAAAEPQEFCEWLAQEALPAVRRQRFHPLTGRCR